MLFYGGLKQQPADYIDDSKLVSGSRKVEITGIHNMLYVW